ncbi:hypothetical protein CWS43_16405 [Rahnella sp. AA]|nr:hypothetical protein CWS43_16405 [Rahnella sp. AA]
MPVCTICTAILSPFRPAGLASDQRAPVEKYSFQGEDQCPDLNPEPTYRLGGSGFLAALNLEVLLSDVSYEAAES